MLIVVNDRVLYGHSEANQKVPVWVNFVRLRHIIPSDKDNSGYLVVLAKRAGSSDAARLRGLNRASLDNSWFTSPASSRDWMNRPGQPLCLRGRKGL